MQNDQETVNNNDAHQKFAESQKREPFAYMLRENGQWFGMGIGFLFLSMMFINIVDGYKSRNNNKMNSNRNKAEKENNNVHILYVEGMDELNILLMDTDYKNRERIFLLFCGSWCPDCVKARPIIDSNLDLLNKQNDLFVNVYVGSSSFWKNKRNIFRRDKRFKLTAIPTLIEYNTQNKLVEVEWFK
eukprot:UN08001